MKPSTTKLIPAAILLCAFPGAALHAQATGTSHPEQLDDTISTPSAPQSRPAKPSPAVPMAQSTSTYPNGQAEVYQPYRGAASDYRGTTAPASGETLAGQPASAAYTRSGDPTLSRRPEMDGATATPVPANTFGVTDDPTSGVVMDVPSRPNEIPQSTLLRTWLTTSISTRTSKPGEHFIATLSGDVVRNNRVLLPSGSTIQGRITAAHSGRGVSNSSVLRLEAQSITLPDGTTYPMRAEVVDVANVSGVHVTGEGVIRDSAMTKGQATMLGGTTGGGAVTGALVGGGVGAVVGATIGAGVGTVLYFRRDREQTLPAHSMLVFALDAPLELNLRPSSF